MFSNKTTNLSAFSILIISLGLPLHVFALNNLKDVLEKDPNIGIYQDLINSNALSLDNLGNFKPDQPINRAAFIKAALTYSGYKPFKTFNYFTGFSDVPEESWFAPYIKKALDIRAIQNPQSNSKFYPEENINRQEALLLAMNIYGIPTPLEDVTPEELFTDIRINHPLAHIYKAAYQNAIYFEKDQEQFKPNKILTRGDAADLLFKTRLATGKGLGSYGHINNQPISNQSIDTTSDLLQNQKFAILMDTWSKINKTYVYTDKINQDRLVYGAITGMVEQLNDPYSNFKSPQSDGTTFIYVPQDYEGIGAVIDLQDLNYIIQTTINNSPADRAGLKSLDIIMKISGQEIKDMTPEQVTNLIKGKAGTSLNLTIKRLDKILEFNIVREKINIESIHQKTVGNSINYLRIDQFTENSAQEFESFLDSINKSASKKLIIDLRNNPGGYLTSTQTILGHFLAKDKVEFYTEDRNKTQTPYLSGGMGELKDLKIVILINEGSASASEIMAGALQDYQLAHLIGTTSYGKGSVQEITNYNDNSSLKLTIAQWLTPNKRNINHLGISPDETIKITDAQKAAGQDPQLDAAITYLNR